MAHKNKRIKELTLYRCPNCRQNSHVDEWPVIEEQGEYKCPKCHLSCSATLLTRIHMVVLRRGRTWVNVKSVSSPID